mmetsp:Transcript_120925/g.349397  ORF Transcript_120925/g.349397 Transcript_120925/m.349397 type:complete len:249 (+) Transcript_120925:279-1025(+)
MVARHLNGHGRRQRRVGGAPRLRDVAGQVRAYGVVGVTARLRGHDRHAVAELGPAGHRVAIVRHLQARVQPGLGVVRLLRWRRLAARPQLHGLQLLLEVSELRDQHAQKQAQEQCLPEQEQEHEEEGIRPTSGTHAGVHDRVPILASHDLEHGDETRQERVKVRPGDAVLTLVPRLRVARAWAPSIALSGERGRLREDLRWRRRLLEVEFVGKEIHHHQRENAERQNEKHQPILQLARGADHGLHHHT